MKRLSKCWFVLFAVIQLFTTRVKAEAVKAAEVRAESSVLSAIPASSRTVQFVHGLANLRFDEWSSSGNYILARVLPEPHNRSNSIISGTIKIVDVLQGSVPKHQWPYRWNYSDATDNSLPELTSIYFSGGTVVCHLDTTAPIKYVFSPMYLIPDESTAYVRPAMQFLQANPLRKIVMEEPQKVNALLHSPNPLITIAMFRELAQMHKLNPDYRDVILQAPPILQATYVYILAQFGSKQQTKAEVRKEEIALLISATKDQATLEAIDIALAVVLNKALKSGPGNPLLSSSSIQSLRDLVKNREISVP